MKIAIPGLRLVNGTNERGLTRGAAMAKAARIAKHRAAARSRVLAPWGDESAIGTSFRRKAMLPVIVTIIRVAPRKLDLGNLWAAVKPVQDGIADAFGVDDREGGPITWRVAQRKGKPREYACELLIEPRAESPIVALQTDTTIGCVRSYPSAELAIDQDHHEIAYANLSAQQLRAFIVQCEAALAELMEREQ